MWFKMWCWIYKRRVQQYVAWANYEIGFSGMGHPTALDRKPPFPKPWLPYFLRREIDIEMQKYAEHKRDIWKKAVFETLGEEI